MERLAAVDLLQLDDMAVASQTDWTLEQLYTIVNRRYEDRRSIVVTAESTAPSSSASTSATRTASRLFEMCEPVPLFGADDAWRLRLPLERPDGRPVQDLPVRGEARPVAGAVPAAVA